MSEYENKYTTYSRTLHLGFFFICFNILQENKDNFEKNTILKIYILLYS